MTDPVTPDQTPPTPATVDEALPQRDMPPPPAHLRQRRFSFVWIIPLVAACIAIYLGYRTIIQQGPLVTITFNNGEGLAEGQTQVKYKAVALGTVESIDLSPDNSHVVVKVRMNGVGTRFLTDHARFWVVRPRISASSFSGLDTLVSGAYIEVDPGAKGGKYKAKFQGLAEPPGIRSDEPGHTYVLRAESIGSLSSGSPVFYRDVVVGEVLGYDLGDGLGPVPINIFVRSPYDRLVRPASHFWNSSGISAGIENGQFHIELQSLQALIAGGVTFDLPHDAENTPPSPNNATFHLYPSQADAESAGYSNQIAVVSYFTDSVAGLGRGAPVQLFGIQVGTVSEVRLMLDPATGKAKVRVAMLLQPERVFDLKTFKKTLKTGDVLQKMVDSGMRAELDTASFITGQKVISLTFVQKADPATISMEGETLVLPSMGGGLEGIMSSASQLMARLNAIPFTQIGNNLNSLLVTANGTIGGAKVQGALTSLSETLLSVQHLVAKTDQGLTPVMRQLPALMANLQGTLRGANVAVTGLARGYGNDSDFQRSLAQLMDQADGALRSVKELATFLDRHPEALILGRTGHATGGQ